MNKGFFCSNTIFSTWNRDVVGSHNTASRDRLHLLSSAAVKSADRWTNHRNIGVFEGNWSTYKKLTKARENLKKKKKLHIKILPQAEIKTQELLAVRQHCLPPSHCAPSFLQCKRTQIHSQTKSCRSCTLAATQPTGSHLSDIKQREMLCH